VDNFIVRMPAGQIGSELRGLFKAATQIMHSTLVDFLIGRMVVALSEKILQVELRNSYKRIGPVLISSP